MATLRTRDLCALGNVSNSPPPKRTKPTKATSTCESDDGACAPKKKRKRKVCEDCKQTQPHFGMPSAKVKRWCGGCAKQHAGAESLTTQKVCEDCTQKQPSFGMPSAKVKRWCGGCAKQHAGAESLDKRKPQLQHKDIAFVRFAGSTQGGVRKRRGVMAPRPTGVHAAHAILGVAMPITDAPPFDFF